MNVGFGRRHTCGKLRSIAGSSNYQYIMQVAYSIHYYPFYYGTGVQPCIGIKVASTTVGFCYLTASELVIMFNSLRITSA